MGSIRITESQTEIDSIPEEIRILVGDVILNFSLLQSKLSSLFSKLVDAREHHFAYLGQNVDISTMTTAIIRMLGSYEKPPGDFEALIKTLKACKKLSEERNKIAHCALIYDPQANLLIRSEIEGGNAPGRKGQILNADHFRQTLVQLKKEMWNITILMSTEYRTVKR
jgi:hypothetical protein